MTAEDPVEFNLMGVNQVQVRENIGLNFAAALRSFLRQDPNIILVGEIRDFETAEIAVKAALTGHLVLSTLHTNDAPSTDQPPDEHGHRAVPGGELAEPGVRPASGAQNLQELHGTRPDATPALMQAGFSAEDAKTGGPNKGKGCEKCNNTGYKGRVGLYEVMEVTEELRELILVGAVRARTAAQGGRRRNDHAARQRARKVKEGVTTIEEIVRETVK